MPHISVPEQLELETRSVVKMGDACFLFAKVALEMWNDKPSWSTGHEIKRALTFPFHNNRTHEVIQAKMGHMDKVDVQMAADLAFTEFYRCVLSKYEDQKIRDNGNVFLNAVLPLVLPEAGHVFLTSSPIATKRGRGRPKKVETKTNA